MTEIGAIGYIAACVAYIALIALLLTAWAGQKLATFLIAACVVSVFWCVIQATQYSPSDGISPALFTTDMLRCGSWYVFLTYLLSAAGRRRAAVIAANVVWLAFLLLGVSWLVTGWDAALTRGTMRVLLAIGQLVTAMTILLLLERLYRGTPAAARSDLRPLMLGLGGIFGYEVLLSLQLLLFDSNASILWAARGAVNLVFVPLLAVSARVNKEWKLEVFVSRQVVFHSFVLVFVAAYALLVGVGSYMLKRYGDSWADVAIVAFIVVAAVLLLLLLWSERLRARLRVFLSKHFFRNKYDYREEWLRLVRILSEFDVNSARHVVIAALADVVRSPAGILWLRDEPSSSYKVAAAYNFAANPPDIDGNEDLIGFIDANKWLVDLEEYSRIPSLYEGISIPDWLQEMESAWLIVPLISGRNLAGMILLCKPAVLPRLNYEDRDLLKMVGNHIAVHLAQQQSDQLLAEAKQFETYNRLTTFLMHDLSNLIAQLSLIIANAEKHKRNPDFVDDALSTIQSSVSRMRRVMDVLRSSRTREPTKQIQVRFVVSAAVDRCSVYRPVPSLELGQVTASVPSNFEEFTMVVAHLIRNAQDACRDDGSVQVVVSQSSSQVKIAVIDNGAGMTAEFVRERLFRPFDSTKGSQGMGIGAYQVREFVRGLGGELKVASTAGVGTRVEMVFPAT